VGNLSFTGKSKRILAERGRKGLGLQTQIFTYAAPLTTYAAPLTTYTAPLTTYTYTTIADHVHI
jgi:hypothetical protein